MLFTSAILLHVIGSHIMEGWWCEDSNQDPFHLHSKPERENTLFLSDSRRPQRSIRRRWVGGISYSPTWDGATRQYRPLGNISTFSAMIITLYYLVTDRNKLLLVRVCTCVSCLSFLNILGIPERPGDRRLC